MAREYMGHILLDRLEEKVLPPQRTALLIVDMQNDFVHDDGVCGKAFGTAMLEGFQAVIEPIRRLADAARWAGVPVFYSMVTQLPDGSLASPVWLADNLRYGFEPIQCMRGTWGHRIIDQLTPQPGDIAFEKTRRSCFQGTGFENLLRARDVRSIVTVGVAASGCVESTVRDAIEKDFFVIVAQDAIGNNTPAMTEACLPTFKALLAPEDLTTTERLISIWSASAPRSQRSAEATGQF
jgi:ureidoacrylate peracid hydrolase